MRVSTGIFSRIRREREREREREKRERERENWKRRKEKRGASSEGRTGREGEREREREREREESRVVGVLSFSLFESLIACEEERLTSLACTHPPQEAPSERPHRTVQRALIPVLFCGNDLDSSQSIA